MNMWQEGSVLPISEVTFRNGMVHGTCPILVEGNEYIFRIKAVNKSSKGHWNYSIPSDPSDSMIAKIRFSKSPINLISTFKRLYSFSRLKVSRSNQSYLSMLTS